MIDDSKLGYKKYIFDEFEFESGEVLHDVEIEYTTRGTPKYDEDGNIINAIVYCHSFNGNCLSVGNLYQLIGPKSELSDFNFFCISITSLGYPESCSPSTTNLKFEFPHYSIKDCVNFKRKLLKEVFNITKVVGVMGMGIGGYETFTWACEYPDELEFMMVGNSSFKTGGYRYIISKTLNSIIDSSDAYFNPVYSEELSKIMLSINSLIYSVYYPKKVFYEYTRDEIDLYMDSFIYEGLSRDIYDFRYQNTSILNYDAEDKLSNIKAKTLIVSASEDVYYNPEFDAYPLKDKIENIEIILFDLEDYIQNDDYSNFIGLFREFLEEFKK